MDFNSIKEMGDLSPHKIIKLLLFGSLFFNYTLIKDKDELQLQHQLETKSLNKIHALELKYERDIVEKTQKEKIDMMENLIRNAIHLENIVDSLKTVKK